MKLPRWYFITVLIWAVVAPSFWWFATGFNGLPFFSLPKLAGPSEGSGWQISLVIQLAIYAALLAPVTTLPWLLRSMLGGNSNENRDA
jgi:hypothetical protein